MNSIAIKVMTVRLKENVVLEFDTKLKDLKLRRDEYLRMQLEREIETLAEISPNSELATRYLQATRMERFSDRLKVGIKLTARLIERINEVCSEKRVPRDLFIESFLDFLVNGWPEFGVDCSPLDKAYEYLNSPYRDTVNAPNLYAQRCSLTEEQARMLDELESI
ncbi:MAG: hypothetical protein WC298_01795 [Sideroxydans sp.]